MSTIIGLVGHCGPDSYMLRSAVKYAVRDADVRMLNSERDLTSAVEAGAAVLLVNRVLDGGFEDDGGIDLIKRAKASWPQVKCLLVSNYADAQAAAETAGALPGFGKSQVGTPHMKRAIETALQTTGSDAKADAP
jgi:DNA-binding NarL/FixJ family response regulator